VGVWMAFQNVLNRRVYAVLLGVGAVVPAVLALLST
jgi:hypothetical protein